MLMENLTWKQIERYLKRRETSSFSQIVYLSIFELELCRYSARRLFIMPEDHAEVGQKVLPRFTARGVAMPSDLFGNAVSNSSSCPSPAHEHAGAGRLEPDML